jgi:type II secretory pathway component PulK
MGRRASILILVLWLLLILSLIGLSFSSSVRTNLSITTSRASRTKARYYAKAGIERTVAELLLRTQDGYYGETSGFYNDAERFSMQPLGDGAFSLLTNKKLETGEPVFGITDEAGRVNINVAAEEALLSFPEITAEMCNSLLDWRDDDFEMRLDGAEDDYYMILPDPYFCKNRELQSIGELLLVRGWTQLDLFGEDVNESGYLDRNEDDGDQTPPLDNANGVLDMGLARFFTIYSRDKELNPNGEQRLALGNATEQQLQQIEGMDQTRAQSLVQWRGNNQLNSLGALFDVTVATQNPPSGQSGTGGNSDASGSSGNQSGGSSGRGGSSGLRGGGRAQGPQARTGGSAPGRGGPSAPSSSAQKAFTFEQAAQLADWVCVNTDDKRNRINLNTAPYEVVMTLPQMTEAVAQEIVNYRTASPFLRRGDLRNVNGMTEEIFKAIIDSVTVQSYQFRIIAEGREAETRMVIETVVDLSTDPPQFLYWREL